MQHAMSDALTTIGGYAIVYGNRSCLVLSQSLSSDQQARARAILTQRVKDLPAGTNTIMLWHPDD